MELLSARCRPQDLFTLCEAAQQDKKNKAQRNYSTDWVDQPHTLLYQFYQGKYKSCIGDYLLAYEDGVLSGGAGYYKYDDVRVLAMSRFYVMPGFENQWIGQHLIKHQIENSRELGKRMIITFNDYNKRIYDIYVNHIEKLPAIWSKFTPIGMEVINHTKQYCCELDLTKEHEARNADQ